MSNPIAAEARRIVRSAACPVPPGATVKAQMNAAADALGYPRGHWRVRAAWKGEAGSWSAAAFAELRGKFDAWANQQERRKHSDKERLALLYAALATKLCEADPDFHRSSITQLIDTARALGGLDR